MGERTDGSVHAQGQRWSRIFWNSAAASLSPTRSQIGFATRQRLDSIAFQVKVQWLSIPQAHRVRRSSRPSMASEASAFVERKLSAEARQIIELHEVCLPETSCPNRSAKRFRARPSIPANTSKRERSKIQHVAVAYASFNAKCWQRPATSSLLPNHDFSQSGGGRVRARVRSFCSCALGAIHRAAGELPRRQFMMVARNRRQYRLPESNICRAHPLLLGRASQLCTCRAIPSRIILHEWRQGIHGERWMEVAGTS